MAMQSVGSGDDGYSEQDLSLSLCRMGSVALHDLKVWRSCQAIMALLLPVSTETYIKMSERLSGIIRGANRKDLISAVGTRPADVARRQMVEYRLGGIRAANETRLHCGGIAGKVVGRGGRCRK